jgi:hypothetical protein
MVRLFLMYKAYRHEKVKLPIIGDLAGGNKDRGQQEPADSRQAVREDSSPAQDGLPSIQNASIPGLLVIPPGGIRSKPAPKTQSEPQAGAVLVQIFRAHIGSSSNPRGRFASDGPVARGDTL